MADTQDTNDETQGSPFSRPAFVIAGVMVLAIVLLGIIVAVRVAGGSNATTQSPPVSTSSVEATPTPAPSAPPNSSESVCGLPAPAETGPLTSAPAATWDYEGTTAYPTSREIGPGETAGEGYRYCFQHSSAGALFATANAMAQSTNSDIVRPWAEYFVSKTGDRERILADLDQPRGDNSGTRFKIAGFKILAYADRTARVDVAVQVSGSGKTVYAAAAYDLIWENGDWKANAAAPEPFNFASIPDLSGYVPWEA